MARARHLHYSISLILKLKCSLSISVSIFFWKDRKCSSSLSCTSALLYFKLFSNLWFLHMTTTCSLFLLQGPLEFSFAIQNAEDPKILRSVWFRAAGWPPHCPVVLWDLL